MEIIIISAIWCPSCLAMKKVYKTVEENFKNIKFKKLDYDFDDIDEFNITKTLPVLILKKDNIELKRIIGEHTSLEIITDIKEALNEK